MGPSGAGKTSLMNAIAGRASGYGVVDGELRVAVDGAAAEGDLSRWSQLCAFVPQDDVMLPELTVRQSLEFYASIRSPEPLSRAQLDRKVLRALETVKLRRVAAWCLFRGSFLDARRGVAHSS